MIGQCQFLTCRKVAAALGTSCTAYEFISLPGKPSFPQYLRL